MKKSVLLFIILVLGGSLLMIGYRIAKPYLESRDQIDTSDSSLAKSHVRIGIDNWVGYVPLCGKELRRRMMQAGVRIQCEDDQADYPARMKKLRDGELDLAVATVDSFLLNGAPQDFPGTIIAVLDESSGGDAIIARKERFAKLEDLKLGGKDQAVPVAFTPASPSEFLLKAMASYFDIKQFRNRKGGWRKEVPGSQDARKQLEQGKVDVAVLWEPDVSAALSDPRFVKLMGTENTKRLIVDILLVRREFAKSSPDIIRDLLLNYFKVLKFYRDQPDDLIEEIATASKLDKSQSAALLKGVRWINLTENARDWFGVQAGQAGRGKESLVATLESTLEILTEHGDFEKNPFPDGDPYRLQFRTFVEELLKDQSQFGTQGPGADGAVSTPGFSELTPVQWSSLTEIGTLKVRPLSFRSATAQLGDSSSDELSKISESLRHFPNFRILVKGHTGIRGDIEANIKLSQERANEVRSRLIRDFGVEAHRIRAQGFGASQPLTQQPDESDRAYEYRLPRVEITLVAEAL
jgi:outer membrane protein OmpA-like peptidoglycan-associated protein